MRACAKCCTIYDVRMGEGSSFVSRPGTARLVAVGLVASDVFATRPRHAGPGVHRRVAPAN